MAIKTRHKGEDGSHASYFIDYDLLLETSLMLHDDILGLFLGRLEKHIGNIQVCLREMRAWVHRGT